MNDAPSRLAAFLAELRRRRVFRVAVVYAGVAFIVIQIIDGAFDYLKIPEWVGSLIIIMLAVGFPIAVGLAWAFDLTAEGLVRAKVKREPTAAKAPHHVIIGNKTLALIATLAVIAAAWSWWGRPDPEAALGKKSIVVLPFANYSKEEGDWFSDGITEEIITHLSKIGDLKVISRTSAMQYKGSDKSLRQIGEELGVAAILEGSVRRAGGKLRITGQLIDPRTDAHLWAESYNREEDLAEIFAIQSDVARKIAAALKATLTPEEKSYIEERPTDNLEAYDCYLKGIVLDERRGRENYEKAISLYEKAVELDPIFALAYARLARAHTRAASFRTGYDRTDERLAQAKSALDRAQALDPDHPEVQLATGYYYFDGFHDFDNAQEHFTLALQKQPNNSDLLLAIGHVKRRRGKWGEAASDMKRAAELDPYSLGILLGVGNTNNYIRNWAEAERYADRYITVAPDQTGGYSRKATVHLRSKGDIERAREIYQEALEKVGPDVLIDQRSYIEILSRDYQKALAFVEADTADRFLRKADIYRYMGRPEQAAAYYDSARVQYEELIKNDPDDRWVYQYSTPHGYLGIAYAGLGRREEAIREGKLAVEIMPLSRDAQSGIIRILTLARIYAMLGEQDAAIDQLEVLLSIPSTLTVPLLKLDPQWDPLRENPRFEGLVSGG